LEGGSAAVGRLISTYAVIWIPQSTHREYRKDLLTVLARLDQLITDADAVLAGPGDVEIYARMEDTREQLVEMLARVEEKLDRLAR
jgi:hypothetical protein